MEYLILNEILRLLFMRNGNHPELFVPIFDKSEIIAAFNFKINAKKFTHVSKSINELLGYKRPLLSNNKSIINQIIHPHDLKLFYDYFDIVHEPNSCIPENDRSSTIKRMKCRIRHLKGYWKYFVFISFNYINMLDNELHKIGLIAEDTTKPYYFMISNFNFHLIMDSIYETKNPENRYIETLKDNEISISKRENEILRLIGRGLIAKEIANKLNISITTVITHRKNLINKFKVKNTAELVGKASKLLII